MGSTFFKLILPIVLGVWSFQLIAEEKPTIRVAMAENFYPFYGMDAEGVPVGASMEIAETVLGRLGYDVRVTQYSDMRSVLEALASGRQDLMVNLTKTPERSKIALFTSTPHLHETQDMIVRADSRITLSDRLLDLTRFRIGVVFGWTYGPEFDAAHFLHKEPVLDSTAQIKGLLAGRFDLAVNNRQFFMNRAESLGIINAFKVLEPAVYTLPVNIAVSRKFESATALRDRLEQAVSDFIQTEEYTLIQQKYGFVASTVTEVTP